MAATSTIAKYLIKRFKALRSAATGTAKINSQALLLRQPVHYSSD
jgi:hypothetical protein